MVIVLSQYFYLYKCSQFINRIQGYRSSAELVILTPFIYLGCPGKPEKIQYPFKDLA